MVAAALILSTFFVAIVLIFQRFGHIAGWTLGEVAFLYGLVELAFGTMDMIFSGFDPGYFGQQVRRGTFDQLLLRPLNITLQVLGSQFVIRRLGRIMQGAVIFGLALTLLDIHWTTGKLMYLPVVLMGMVCFFGGLFIIGATITFWTVESIEVVNIFTYGGSEMISYPMHIYPGWLRRFFTFIIPAAFLNYYPALYFLDKSDPYHPPLIASFLAPVAGFGMLAVALLFWRFGVKHYQSTGT
ncbi:MAG: ABC transporter permease [Anaerolineae bacterium]|nr:ABC transporter permease [Anaerolineae bacterium]